MPPEASEPHLRLLRDRLTAAGLRPDPATVGREALALGLVLGGDQVRSLSAALRRDLLGAGPLEALVATPGVTDVLVNGTDGAWVDRGAGLEPVDLGLDAGQVRALAVRLAAQAGRRLDDAAPWVDARLPDGTRLHAVLPPLVEGAAHLSLRVPSRRALSLADLTDRGTVPEPWLPVLRSVVRARLAYLVSGGTGAGKTTLLAALLGEVARGERLLLVEDCPELVVDHPHTVRLQSRAANVEGAGGVGLVDLVRQALRMRPDRVVVGEVRGAEVRELLTALNTGHDGGCGTIHANAAADVPARVEALGALAGLGPDAVRSQLAAAVQLVLHVRRDAGRRRLVEVSVLRRSDASGRPHVEVVPALTDHDGVPRTGPAWPELRALADLPDGAL